MCQELRERFFDLVVWFNTMRKMLTGEGGRHRRTLRGRREEAGAAGLVPGPPDDKIKEPLSELLTHARR